MFLFFTPVIENVAFGDARFAYGKTHGASDVLLYYALFWNAALSEVATDVR